MKDILAAVNAQENDVSLWLFRDNHTARKFYVSFGFADDGREQTREIGGADLVECRMLRRAR